MAGQTLMMEPHFNRQKACNFIKRRFCYKCFAGNFAIFLRAATQENSLASYFLKCIDIYFLRWLLCAINFYRILNYFTKVFTLGVLFFKKQVFLKDLPRKCADAQPNAEIFYHAICKIAVSYPAICKIGISYRAICMIGIFYHAICKVDVCYRANCKIVVSYRAICKLGIFYRAICKVGVCYRAICMIGIFYYAICKIASSYRAICKIGFS